MQQLTSDAELDKTSSEEHLMKIVNKENEVNKDKNATYIHCNRGTPYKKPCPPGLIFDPSSKTCNWSWAYNCPGGSEPAPTTAKTTSATQQYPEPETTPWQPSKPSGNSCNKKIVCYYPNWAHYRKGTILKL